MESSIADHVVLVDEEGRELGLAPRESVHGKNTPLHRGFSCYVYRDTGEILVSRRALSKRSWPGVWTNAFCGHPRQGEEPEATVRRYAQHELGLRLEDVRCVLPGFRYRAVDASGTVENELCPVFTARTAGPIAANPDEAVEHRWVSADELRRWVDAAPWSVSPWMVEQLTGVLATLTPQPAGDVAR